jgi:AraC-like DNA-binding protein
MESYPKMYLYRRIVQAKLFIDKHYAERIDLSQIADEAFFSRFHFMRLFKQAYGKTPHHYLTQVRLDKARELLAQGNPVTKVCYQVGFDSPASFANLFKRRAGASPSAYQTAQLQKQALYQNNPLYAEPNCFAETHGWKK